MTRLRYIIMAVSAALLGLSCQRIEAPAAVGDGAFDCNSAIGTIEGLSTKITLEQSPGGYKVIWNDEDTIAVTDGNKKAFYKVVAGGAPSATFSRTGGDALLGGRVYRAYYPASLAGGVLPGVQLYKGGRVDVPMSAEAESLNFAFKNICGLIRLGISTSLQGVKLSRIEVSADQGMSGPFHLNNNSAVVSGSGGITLDCGDGGIPLGASPTALFVSVPPGGYTGLKIKIINSEGGACVLKLKEGATYIVERSGVCNIEVSADSFIDGAEADGMAILRPGGDFNQMLKRLSGTRRDVLGGDSVVRRIVFDTGSLSEEGLRVDSYDSPYPIYLRFDAGTGVATVSTRAGRISTGAISAYTFSALYALEEIENLRALCTEEAVTMNEMFAYAGLYADSSRFDVSGFRTPKVTTMYRMFYHCESLTELDLSGFDTSNVKDMDNMFSYCFKLKGLNLSSFNTSQVGVLRSMFNRCASIEELNLDHFDLSAATLASYMFYKMENLRRLSITGFNIGRSGLNINYMFSHCPNLEELRLGGDFVMSGGVPTAFFTSSADKKGVRTSSLAPEGLVIHCPENVADWLATTTLRWVYSGYSGSGRVNVRFFDSDKEYFPTWAAN